MNEVWKMVPNFENRYQVSNLGRVRSLDRIVKDVNGVLYNKKGKILSTKYNNKNDYVRVNLYDESIKRHTTKVHKLVARVFLKQVENKPFINHKNGNKHDNRVENLEWCTASENINHAFDNNLIPRQKGGKNGNSKLTEREVVEIKKLIKKGDTQFNIANRFGVKQATISSIKLGYTWRHVEIK
jgi:hypothetical protein